MPTSPEAPEILVDTSAAVAFVLEDHEHHGEVSTGLRGRRIGLAGHALFETYSVLTRLPGAARRRPDVVVRLLAVDFPATRHLSAAGAADLIQELPSLGVAGGSVHDALVGATAREHGVPLATRDRRAISTYRALGVAVEVVGTLP